MVPNTTARSAPRSEHPGDGQRRGSIDLQSTADPTARREQPRRRSPPSAAVRGSPTPSVPLAASGRACYAVASEPTATVRTMLAGRTKVRLRAMLRELGAMALEFVTLGEVRLGLPFVVSGPSATPLGGPANPPMQGRVSPGSRPARLALGRRSRRPPVRSSPRRHAIRSSAQPCSPLSSTTRTSPSGEVATRCARSSCTPGRSSTRTRCSSS